MFIWHLIAEGWGETQTWWDMAYTVLSHKRNAVYQMLPSSFLANTHLSSLLPRTRTTKKSHFVKTNFAQTHTEPFRLDLVTFPYIHSSNIRMDFQRYEDSLLLFSQTFFLKTDQKRQKKEIVKNRILRENVDWIPNIHKLND